MNNEAETDMGASRSEVQQARSLLIFQQRSSRKKQLFRLYIRLLEYTSGNVAAATGNALATHREG